MMIVQPNIWMHFLSPAIHLIHLHMITLAILGKGKTVQKCLFDNVFVNMSIYELKSTSCG